MDTLSQLRAEIKHWERDFASIHGRDPSLSDIRDNPAIADKYKLYKKLSKAGPRLPVPKSRPADDRPPPPGFNPFSPTKKAASVVSRAPRTSPRPNPFATPTKNKPNPRRPTSPSPDPFSPIAPPRPTHNPSSSSTTAVSRARKRLRGDPVSPSPNKPKRQRIPSRLPPSPEQHSPSSPHESDHELPLASSFVADSPVKAPACGKSFKVLFDDVLPALSIPKKLVPPAPHPPFLHRDPLPSSLKLLQDRNPNPPNHKFIQRGISVDHSHNPAPSQVPQPRPSMKRTLDLVPEHAEPPSQCSLVPPSPPPQEPVNRDSGKPKAKPTASRKKPRVDDHDSDDELDVTLKIATRKFDQANSHRHPDDLDWDPLLRLPTRNHDLATDEIHHASGTLRVDLPDKFRRVLAISPSRSQSGMEERVVRGLLHGHRVGHYNPSKGGDIWDAGETNECTRGDPDTEEDWEGEPVPWEVGEL